MERRITGTTKLLGLIGTPVEHSGSPAMYNYCFEALGYDYAYLAFDVTLERLPAMMEAANTMHMKGMNVTMPLKQAVVLYMDKVTPAAKLIGACNTLVNEGGAWIGYNTDGMGYVLNLRDNGVEVTGKKMTVLGAGGAGTAVQVQCALDGAREIAVFNPKDAFFEHAQETAIRISKEVPGCTVRVYDLNDTKKLQDEVEDSEILVNATRVGMAPNNDVTPIQNKALFRPDLIVTDVIYNPVETKLLKDAKACGCKTIGGQGMLVWQGAEAFHLYTGDTMPVEEVKKLFF
ncbi:shikimate dehydrogenase [Lachnospiraceae bacterium LCP25S3_G4]